MKLSDLRGRFTVARCVCGLPVDEHGVHTEACRDHSSVPDDIDAPPVNAFGPPVNWKTGDWAGPSPRPSAPDDKPWLGLFYSKRKLTPCSTDKDWIVVYERMKAIRATALVHDSTMPLKTLSMATMALIGHHLRDEQDGTDILVYLPSGIPMADDIMSDVEDWIGKPGEGEIRP